MTGEGVILLNRGDKIGKAVSQMEAVGSRFSFPSSAHC